VKRSRTRIWALAFLACCAVALFVASRLTSPADSVSVRGNKGRAGQDGSRTITQCVEAVVAEFKIPRSAMRILPAAKGAGVQEMRLKVDPAFSSYEFQSALAGALDGLEASVIGTESTKTKTISLQIMKDGAQVLLVTLDLRQSPLQRKESRH
jgi:hypothetical protein